MDGTNSAYFLHQLAIESSLIHPSWRILTYLDNKFLYNSVNTTTQIADWKLQVEMSVIREMKENCEIELNWFAKNKEITDWLTMKGAACLDIMLVLQNGKLCH